MPFDIREATKDDIPELARLHLASKLAAETGVINQAYLDGFTQDEFEQKWVGFLDAEDSQQYLIFKKDKSIGLISFGQLRTPPAGMSKIRPLYSSEIYAIYVHPDYFKQGAGQALLRFAVSKLKEQKHQSMCLWALDKNKRACGFYEAMGGKRVGKQMVEFGPTKAKEACYAWRDISEILDK